jgi:hypothetical protein
MSETAQPGLRRSSVKRTAAKLVRYTPDELRRVTGRARECGRPVACYIRELSLGLGPHLWRRSVRGRLIRHLSHIANLLRECERERAETGSLNAGAVGSGLAELLDIIRSID